MNALQAIIDEVSSAGFPYQVGYGSDLGDFLESQPTTSGVAFVQIGYDTPTRHYDDNVAPGFVGTFVIWLRVRYAKGREASIYQQYLDMRSALNGKKFDGGTLKIVSAIPAIAGGMAEPQLVIEART